MPKEKIPVYDICTLSDKPYTDKNFLAENFSHYLKRHSAALHLPHRHDFYHLVLFTKGSGYHTIDFTRFKVKPYEIYFMIPGQVHSWEFEGAVDGYIVHFSDNLFKTFLLNPNYLDRFSFFDGISENSVCQIPLVNQNEMTRLFEQILLAVESPNEMDIIRLLLLQIFMLVSGYGKTEKKKAGPETKQILLRNFRKLIDQQFLRIKLPKQYAELLYVTPNHLNALCQDCLEKPPVS